MTLKSFLKKRKASIMKGLEHAEAVATKTLEILNFDCGLLTVLQDDQQVTDTGYYRKKANNKRLRTIEKLNDYNCLKQSNEKYVKSMEWSVALSPYDEILVWLDEVAIQAKNDSLNEEEKLVITQFITELLSSSDKNFVSHLEEELVKSGLHEHLDKKSNNGQASSPPFGGCRGFEVSIAEEASEKAPVQEEEESVEEEVAAGTEEAVETTEAEDAEQSSVERCLLYFLQNMLADERSNGPTYNRVIEALHSSGLGDDFINKLREKPLGNDTSRIEELKKQLEEALAAKSDAESKLGDIKSTVKGSSSDGTNVASTSGTFTPPPPPPMPGTSGSPMPGPSGSGIPSPMSGTSGNPMPGPSGSGIPPPMPGTSASATPGTSGSVIPPPPPMPGAPSCPPPPRMDGTLPPPPEMSLPPGMAQSQDDLPLGLKPKKKWRNSGSFRKANWKKIVPQNLTENSFWLNVQEENLAKTHILNELDERFSAKPKKQTENVRERRTSNGSMKKIKQVKVLDSKIAQNISILLGGSFKQMNYDVIKRCLLQCDNKTITESILEQLIQYLPHTDQLAKLQEFKENYEDLVEAEQFCLKVSEIDRLLPRLKAMQFRQRYYEMEQDIKPNITAVTVACNEVRKSEKFAKILELILLLGNYLNSGSRNEQAFGFEISFLPTLKNTKDNANQSSLLHFLVETVERDFPHLLDFHEEMPHIDEASKVSVDVIGSTLKQIGTSLKTLEFEIKNYKPQNEDDKFLEVMESFSKEARIQTDVMQEMFTTVQNLHEDLAEYYAFKTKTYSLKDFFTHVTLFKNHFVEIRKENERKKKDTEEKEKKTRLAKEKADAKKQKKESATKQAEKPSDNELECLLDVLSQTAECSKQKRKRSVRVAVGERRPELVRSRSRSNSVSRAG